MKSQAEIEVLKLDWENDPIWDIEDTEGFEDHYIELKAYRLGKEVDWEQKRKAKLWAKSHGFNCNTELAEYILSLETRIKELELLVIPYEDMDKSLLTRLNENIPEVKPILDIYEKCHTVYLETQKARGLIAEYETTSCDSGETSGTLSNLDNRGK